MNAIDMLTTQHRGMEAAFGAALELDGDARREKFEQAADILMSHVAIEERHFFPAIKAKRTEDSVLEMLEEHLSLKRLVADLLELSSDDIHYTPKLHVLKEQAEHHHKEEEKELFPIVKKLLSKEELEALGDLMFEAQRNLLPNEPRKRAQQENKVASELR
jgi:hemerythrin superfamily protein